MFLNLDIGLHLKGKTASQDVCVKEKGNYKNDAAGTQVVWPLVYDNEIDAGVWQSFFAFCKTVRCLSPMKSDDIFLEVLQSFLQIDSED